MDERFAYEPVHDLRSGRFSGVEVVPRRQHDTTAARARNRGWDARQIAELDAGTAVSAVAAARAGGGVAPVQVDVAADTVLYARDRLRPMLAGAALAPLLEIGPPIAAAAPAGQLLPALAELRRWGFRIGLDGAGRGFGPEVIAAVRPDVVKLEPELADGVLDAGTGAVVRAVLEVARVVGAPVAATGVRDRGRLAGLYACGVVLAQGPLLGGARADPWPSSTAPAELLRLLRGTPDGPPPDPPAPSAAGAAGSAERAPGTPGNPGHARAGTAGAGGTAGPDRSADASASAVPGRAGSAEPAAGAAGPSDGARARTGATGSERSAERAAGATGPTGSTGPAGSTGRGGVAGQGAMPGSGAAPPDGSAEPTADGPGTGGPGTGAAAAAPVLDPAAAGPPVSSLAAPAVTLPEDATGGIARDTMQEHPDAAGVVLVDAGHRPVGYLDRSRFLLTMAGRFGHALWADKPARPLADAPRTVDERTPLGRALELSLTGDPARGYDDLVVVAADGACRGVVAVAELWRRAIRPAGPGPATPRPAAPGPPPPRPPASGAPAPAAPSLTAPGPAAPSPATPGPAAPATTAPGPTAPGPAAPAPTAPGPALPGPTAARAPGPSGPGPSHRPAGAGPRPCPARAAGPTATPASARRGPRR